MPLLAATLGFVAISEADEQLPDFLTCSFDYTSWTNDQLIELDDSLAPLFKDICKRLWPRTDRQVAIARAVLHMRFELDERYWEEKRGVQLELPFDPPLPR